MSFRETESQKHPEILERIYHKIFEFLNKILKRNELLFLHIIIKNTCENFFNASVSC